MRVARTTRATRAACASRALRTRCARAAPRAAMAQAAAPPPLVDPSSLASAAASGAFELRVAHAEYALAPDFGSGTIEGYAALTLARADGDDGSVERTLYLDTRELAVASVDVLDDVGAAVAPAVHELGDPTPALGALLTVSVPAGAERVGVRYTTSTTCSAVQFLTPTQTAGGEHPYLFSQCQAIHARSLVVCQDCPAIKSTFSAVVFAPPPLVAVMGATALEASSGEARAAEALARARLGGGVKGDARAFAFEQRVPIPSYLTALAVGNLERREIGPRSVVWSEPEMVDAGAYEFAETEDFLAAGEAVAGPYVWGRYDLLLLPPSFPYGGMENPQLTFVTPTLIAGDRSLSNVVAHEVAHSWTGNLVGCRSWENFWLNEGFTVFLERKILARARGDPSLFDFKALGGWDDLKATVATIGAEHNYTRLVPDLSDGNDPDDAFSRIPCVALRGAARSRLRPRSSRR